MSAPAFKGEKKKWTEETSLPERFDSVSNRQSKLGPKECKASEEEASNEETAPKSSVVDIWKKVEDTKITATVTDKYFKLRKEDAKMTTKVEDVVKGPTKTVVMFTTAQQTAPPPTIGLMSQKALKADVAAKNLVNPKSSIPEALGPKGKLLRMFGECRDGEPKLPFGKPIYVYDPSKYMLLEPMRAEAPIDLAVGLAEVQAQGKDMEDQAQWD